MKPIWEIDDATLERWRNFVEENKKNELVLRRVARNIKRKEVDLSKANIWKVFVGCQVTTQQRSGPDTPVGYFLNSKSPALDYAACKKSSSIEELLKREFSKAGLRRGNTMADYLSKILSTLENGEWETLLKHLSTIESRTTREKELKVAQYLQSNLYPGLGPKQSRNFIQWLGLSRYEIPLDSRVLKKLKELGCEFVPPATALSDETVYRLLQDGVQQLAAMLNIYPCYLDACIFSSFDETDE